MSRAVYQKPVQHFPPLGPPALFCEPWFLSFGPFILVGWRKSVPLSLSVASSSPKSWRNGAGEVNGPGWLRVAWGTSPAVHLEGMWYLWPCSCQQGRWAPGQEGRPHGRAWKVNQRGVDNALPGSPWNTGASRDTGAMCWNPCTHTAVTQACCHTASCGLLGWCFLCKHGRSGGQGAIANTCVMLEAKVIRP